MQKVKPVTPHGGCTLERVVLLQDSIYSNIGLQKEEESLDSNFCQHNLTKADIFTSPLLYSAHLQEFNLSLFHTPGLYSHPSCLACSCEPDF